MGGFSGWAELLNASGEVADYVRAELWSTRIAGEPSWSGDLLPINRVRFAPGVRVEPGDTLELRLPNGRSARCEVERVRNGDPELIRIGGRGDPPFG